MSIIYHRVGMKHPVKVKGLKIWNGGMCGFVLTGIFVKAQKCEFRLELWCHGGSVCTPLASPSGP